MSTAPDAVVIGAGPNGLAAAIALAQAGASVLVLEQAQTIGGGTRTEELTLPGFRHDVCSAVHPLAILSPFLRTLPLERFGLTWVKPRSSVAHPLDDGMAVNLLPSIEDTAAALGHDARSYRRLITPFVRDPHPLLADLLGPLRWPRHPVRMARFGLLSLRSAVGVGRRFRGTPARALLAGCAAHSILPLERLVSGAVALMFLITGHIEPWPVAAGGSSSITHAMRGLLVSLGGRVETGVRVCSLRDLPSARVYVFDTSPNQLAEIAEPILPKRYASRLRRYRYGPGVFKLDWALDGPIPWKDPACLLASTVHIGGTFEEIAAAERAVWNGEQPERPFVLLCQQSQLDPGRAPEGRHTGYAYTHVPPGSTVDLTEIVERQVDRFAPGFRDRILARHTTRTDELERYNPNYVGGAITGGVADLFQLFTRPVARFDPYSTPHPRLFICSASTPPGGGVHGMCGFFAARSAISRLHRYSPAPLA
jgi:phytoene dehydrogenase-like protein